jgi:aerobic carbon-monoxide dehydrogenase large subunit
MTGHASPSNRLIGAPIPRIEDLRFLRGRGEYVADVALDGMLHAAILRSSVAHGRIRALDVGAARVRPGVHAVITAAEIGTVPRVPLRLDVLPEFDRYRQPVMAVDRVRYVGEPIALVLAESAALAEDALEAIAVEIEPLPVVADRAAARADAHRLFDGDSNIAGTLVAVKGDAARAVRGAPYVRRERFKVQRFTAVPMEPRGFLAHWDADAGRMTVFGAAKVTFANRRMLAPMLGLAESAVRMVVNDVGGGFGARGEFYPEDFLIPFAARFAGRPVRWIEDRRENLMACNHARDAEIELTLATDRDGKFLALLGEASCDIGAYVRTNGPTPARNLAQVITGAYAFPDIRMEVALVLTNKTPVGTYRGPGRFEADFFRERLIDMAAEDLGIDRVELRRRNLIPQDAMPYQLATVERLNIQTETDSGDYAATFDRCLKEFDWAGKAETQGRLIDGRYHGSAIGCYIEGGGTGPRENARLALQPDGRIAVYLGSTSVGQGVETVFAQIAADALDLPMDAIASVAHGSTDIIAEGFGSYSSRSVVMGGSAVLDAAGKLKAALRAAAAKRLGCGDAEVTISPGIALGPDGREIAWGDLAGDNICADGTFANTKRTYSYGAHAAHVAVDPKTGRIDVLDYVAVEDVGRIINPETLHGQCVGAIVQGLGGAVMEHLVYDADGQLLTGTLADYLMPTASDFPAIRAYAMERVPAPGNPLGAKGAGEGGIVPVGGVIANAVAAALKSFDVQPRELPLSPPRLWAMINTPPS